MKILVVGFPRSGTSLTYRIFEKHPQVKRMFFEKWVIKKSKTKEEFYNRFPIFSGGICGEKVICEKRVTGKIGKTNQTMVDYCLKWNDWFGKEAKIVQIIRYPFDALNSLVMSKNRFKRGPMFNLVYQEYLKFIPDYMVEISKIHNCKTIQYENLIEKPDETIKSLYKHCGLDPNFKFQEGIRKDRAYKFLRNDKLLFEYDDRIEGIINKLNKIKGVKFPHYDL